MPRKTNPEKNELISPGSAASSAPAASPRSRRTGTGTRAQHTAKAPETPAVPAREPETSARAEAVAMERELSHEEIARLAYALWQERGCQHGNPDEDWRRAEEQLRQLSLATVA
jgi:Protein of unknown function (DUF2934)